MTIWFCYFTEIETLVEFAVNYSKNQNIVESEDWANQIEETGIGGWGKDVNKGRTAYNKGKPKPESEKLKLSITKRGKPNGDIDEFIEALQMAENAEKMLNQ